MRLRAPAVAAAAVLALGLLAACGDDADAPDAGSTDTASTDTASLHPAGQQLDAAQTEAALLAADDLPEGWVKGEYDGDDDSDTTMQPAKCNDLLENIGDDGPDTTVHEAGVTFEQVATGSELTMEVATHSDTFDQEKFDAGIETLLDECSSMSTTVEDQTLEVQLIERELTQLGDKTYALRMDMQVAGFSMVSDLVVVAAGHNAITFTTVGFEPMPPADLEKVVKAGVAGVEEAGSGAAA